MHAWLHMYVRTGVEVAFAHAEVVRVYESQAVFNVCLVIHGESSCPVSALVTTCDGSSSSLDLTPATSKWEGGVCLCEGEEGVCLSEGWGGLCLGRVGEE